MRKKFAVADYLNTFAAIAKNSKEYQGHGWGCAYLDDQGKWQLYRNIKPIWQDNLKLFGKTKFLVAHARSAFRDEEIKAENNMPFYDGKNIFIFNGELRGVRLRQEGRIGAEKIFNFIRQFGREGMILALRKGVEIIRKKTRYVKAMNIIIADQDKVYLASSFNENEDYFTLHYKELDKEWDTELDKELKPNQELKLAQELNNNLKTGFIICSEAFPEEEGWKKIENNTIREFV